MRRDAPRVALAGLLFLLSGAAALVYQVAWQRLLALHSGVGLYSVAMIVAAFMAGLGIGSHQGGRLSTRMSARRALVAFAVLELLIGAFGAASSWIYYDWLYPRAVHLPSPSWQAGLLHLAALLPPTVLMGMSLPFLVHAVVTDVDAASRRIGWLYGVNVLGAAAGRARDAVGSLPVARRARRARRRRRGQPRRRAGQPRARGRAVGSGRGRSRRVAIRRAGRGSRGAGRPAAAPVAAALRALRLRGAVARDRLVPAARRRRQVDGLHVRHAARHLPARVGDGLARGGVGREPHAPAAAGVPADAVRGAGGLRRAAAAGGRAARPTRSASTGSSRTGPTTRSSRSATTPTARTS